GAAGLVETLSGDGPFTVFAPTDAAFALLPEGLVATLLEDPSGQLTTILTQHVYAGIALSTDLYDGMMVPTIAGGALEVTIDSTGVYIDNAMVTLADIETSNGVVHVIDAVLLPLQGELTACPYPYYFEYDSNYTIADISMCITYIIEGCTNSLAENYNPEANLEDGTCVIIGCMSEDAYNYNAAATLQDESCILYGCTNETAENFNDLATDDDGSCIIYGCILEIFPNYNPQATVDDLSCNPNGMELYGCTNQLALNYDSQANMDNGSCIYQDSLGDCVSQIQEESIPLYLPGGWTIFGYTCIEPVDAILGFSNVIEQVVIVKDSEGNVYIPEFGFNGIGDLIYSRGYQIKTTQEITDFSFCPTLLVTENTPQREVGDLAEGGIVFYVDETGQHGLVAALEDLTEGATDPNGFGFDGFEWGCFFENVSGADGQAIGTGYQNTMDIVSQGCVTENGGITAAQAALGVEVNGYIDWCLPSIDELNVMYNTIGPGGLESNIGGFEISVNSYYWSSSEINNMTAWGVYFDNGDLELSSKNNARRVRVIRAF
ncbi:MAG: fasciclin domain-containing protein, partial [Flavobacteriales bacterium]|nr:fasciclin domain-containing protein [Flavobacteriales bacterium]